MNIKEAWMWLKAELAANNIDSAALDASLLLEKVTLLNRVQQIAHDDRSLLDKELRELQELLKKRQQGYPMAYIMGFKEFYGLKLKVTPATLIPRPDTETLVDHFLSLNIRGSVLDLGTGSGAIILALKHELKDKIKAYATDVCESTLKVAQENAKRLNLEVEFLLSDWFSNLKPLKFDAIVSNPPYIDENDAHLHETSLPFEPRQALVSDEHGLGALTTLIREAKAYLKDKAPLLLEHGYNQSCEVRKTMLDEGYSHVQTLKDLGGNDRVTLGFRN